MSRWKKAIIIITTVAASVAIGAAITYVATRTMSNLPADIRSDLSFSPLVPTGNKLTTSDYKLSNVGDDGAQMLSYIVTINNSKIVVSQYVQPDQFTDVPEYKERFLSGALNRTNTVQTSNGVIYIGKPDTDSNNIVGVMLERGLIVFFYPPSTLPDETWRAVGDSLVVDKTTN